ncbi:hypothetical protein CYMTET_28057 [Cymbomonas tetramitiformis]|uniref:Uncharacterized protein n=1 Tax=Cymbomonas tetramitiformis TaxID=36881 RepID=A0AAE0FQ35_9CHLO|nr:hypothetical protein CYMTET_28057 [Cymbomonas tetramitiformis]
MVGKVSRWRRNERVQRLISGGEAATSRAPQIAKANSAAMKTHESEQEGRRGGDASRVAGGPTEDLPTSEQEEPTEDASK